jgi:hypothetical protein
MNTEPPRLSIGNSKLLARFFQALVFLIGSPGAIRNSYISSSHDGRGIYQEFLYYCNPNVFTGVLIYVNPMYSQVYAVLISVNLMYAPEYTNLNLPFASTLS